MKFKHKSVPLTSLLIDHTGCIEPLCNSCINSDCSNQIEEIDVSFLGVNKKCKVLNEYSVSFVIDCEGYIKKGTENENS